MEKEATRQIHMSIPNPFHSVCQLMLPELATPSHLQWFFAQFLLFANKIELPQIFPFSFPC